MSPLATSLLTAPASAPEALTEFFADRAAAVDAGGADTQAALERLGASGLLDTDAAGPDYSASFEVVRAIARSCVASAFSAWAHRMAVEYLSQWPTPLTEEALLPALRRGERAGATAMAAAIAAKLGLGELGVALRVEGDEVVLDGKVRWASNLYPDAVVVLPARTDDDAGIAGAGWAAGAASGDAGTAGAGAASVDAGAKGASAGAGAGAGGAAGAVVVAVPVSADGVSVDPPPPLLALDGTASSSLRLDGVRLDARHVVSTDLDAFLAGVRRPFLLLQSAFCVGLTEAALAAAPSDGLNAVFGPDRERVEARLAALLDTLGGLLADPAAEHRAVLSARLSAAEIAGEATALESRTRGGAGYVRTSATARRLREAAFLPVQSPTEAQLRWELSNSAS